MLELIFFVLFVFLLYKLQPEYLPRLWDRSRGVYPPGPSSFPLIGTWMSSSVPNWITLDELGKKYGGVYSMFWGKEFTVVLTDVQLIKHVCNNPDFDGRPLNHPSKAMLSEGLSFADGPGWKERRRMTISAMKSVGFVPSQTKLDFRIQFYANLLIKKLESTGENPFTLRSIIDKIVVQASCDFISEGAIDVDHSDFEALTEAFHTFYESTAVMRLTNIFPFLGRLPIPPFSTFQKKVSSAASLLHRVMEQNIQRRMKEPFDENKQPRDFFDAYRRQLIEHHGSSEPLDKKILEMSMEMLLAGCEDVTVLTLWIFLIMLHHPDVQRKCQLAIDDAAASGEVLSVANRDRLGYIDALISETLRYCLMVPFPLPRRAMVDSEIGGYPIPRDTLLLLIYYSMSQSKEVWGDPELFRPERFLDESGRFIPSHDEFGFGTGRRVCVGEQFTRMLVFGLVTAALKNFEFSSVGRIPSLEERQIGLVAEPMPYNVTARRRLAK